LPLTVGSCLWWKFLIWLSLNMFSYIFLGSQLLQATPWSCFACSREYLKLSRISIYLSMAFNSYPLPYAYVLWIWSWIYLCNPPPRNISIHYLSWQVIIIFVVNILILFTLSLALNCLICFTKDLFWSNSHLSSLYLLDPLLLYLKFVLCFLELGKAMNQFLCIDLQKSYFLIMHYSLGSYPTLSKTPFFKLVLQLLAFLEHD